VNSLIKVCPCWQQMFQQISADIFM
jgi:hypothetical protein